MYRPHDRARVMLMLTLTMVLFVGVLALPLLVEKDVVRLGFDASGDPEEGDGLRVQSGVTDGLLHSKSVDGPRPSRVLVASPAATASATFSVSWDSDGPDPAGTYAFHLQYGAITNETSGSIAWQDWFRLRQSDQARDALFTGEPGASYHFRGRACSLGVHCGAWSEPSETHIAADAPDPEIRLDITATEPAPAEVVEGRVAIAWRYDHRGPGSAMVDIALRPTGAEGSVPLYSGQGLSVVWDTTRHDDGTYVIRLDVGDGVHRLHQEVPVRIQNGPAGDALGEGGDEDHGGGAQQGDATGDVGESPGHPFVLTLLCLAALVARRRF